MSNPYSPNYYEASTEDDEPELLPDNVLGPWPERLSDPYETQAAMLKAIEFGHRRRLEDFPFAHQTLIALELESSDYSPKLAERLTRLAASLNMPNTIKADIVTIADGHIYEGIYFGGTDRGGIGVDLTDLGYNLVLVQSAFSIWLD